MRAPNNKPTEKTEARLAEEQRLLDAQPIKVDMATILESLLEDEKVQEEVMIEAKKRLDSEDAVVNVKAILSEYFQTFIIMGYDINGERLVVKKSVNDRDEDSLIEMMRFILMKNIQGS